MHYIFGTYDNSLKNPVQTSFGVGREGMHGMNELANNLYSSGIKSQMLIRPVGLPPIN